MIAGSSGRIGIREHVRAACFYKMACEMPSNQSPSPYSMAQKKQDWQTMRSLAHAHRSRLESHARARARSNCSAAIDVGARTDLEFALYRAHLFSCRRAQNCDRRSRVVRACARCLNVREWTGYRYRARQTRRGCHFEEVYANARFESPACEKWRVGLISSILHRAIFHHQRANRIEWGGEPGGENYAREFTLPHIMQRNGSILDHWDI